MNKTNTLMQLSKGAYSIKRTLVTQSPKILFGFGVGVTVAGIVNIVLESFETKDILEDMNDKIETINEDEAFTEADMDDDAEMEFDNDDLKFQTLDELKKPFDVKRKKVYMNTGVKIVKTYIPGVLMVIAGIACFTGSNMILERRYKSAVETIGLLWTSHMAYRDRVKEAVGEEAEHDIYHNLETRKVLVDTVDENGNVTTEEMTIKTPKDNVLKSPTAIRFDETNPYFKNDAFLNKEFLIRVEQAMNSMLRYRGVVFLNDIYKALGVNATEHGQYLGWVLDRNLTGGDGEIKFILVGEGGVDFMNNWEKSVTVDFNIDPVPVSTFLWTLGPSYNGPSEHDLITASNV